MRPATRFERAPAAACTGCRCGGTEVGAATSFDDTRDHGRRVLLPGRRSLPGRRRRGRGDCDPCCTTRRRRRCSSRTRSTAHSSTDSLQIQASASDGAGSGVGEPHGVGRRPDAPGAPGAHLGYRRPSAVDGHAYTRAGHCHGCNSGTVSTVTASVTVDNSAPRCSGRSPRSRRWPGARRSPGPTHGGETYSVSRNGTVVAPDGDAALDRPGDARARARTSTS